MASYSSLVFLRYFINRTKLGQEWCNVLQVQEVPSHIMRGGVAYFLSMEIHPIYSKSSNMKFLSDKKSRLLCFPMKMGFRKKDIKCLISKLLTRTYELLTKNETHNGYLITKSRTQHTSLNRFFVFCVMEFGMIV